MNLNQISSVGKVVSTILKREWQHLEMDLSRPDRLRIVSI